MYKECAKRRTGARNAATDRKSYRAVNAVAARRLFNSRQPPPLALPARRRDRGIAYAEIGIGRIVTHAILARTALNRRHAIASQLLIRKQRGRHARM